MTAFMAEQQMGWPEAFVLAVFLIVLAFIYWLVS